MKTFVIVILCIVVSCNALLLKHDKDGKDERNGEIITYLRGIKGENDERVRPAVVDKISTIFREVFNQQEDPPKQPSFFERIINFFRNLNIFGLRFNRPPPEDELRCIDSNDLRCTEIFKGIKNSKFPPVFVHSRSDRENDDEDIPLFWSDRKKAEISNVVKKEVKQSDKADDDGYDPVDQD